MEAPSSESQAANQPAVPGPSNADVPLPMTSKRTLKSLTDEYRVSKQIGKGSFGVVYRSSAVLSKRTVAIKILKGEGQKFMAEREFELCLLFTGFDNFVKVLDFFDYRGRPCLVFELLEENMLNYIHRHGPIPIKAARPLAKQLLEALDVLKQKDIVHGDLKPVNIMIKNTKSPQLELKIIDLGGAMHLSECFNAGKFQTLHFRAPEVIITAPCNEKVDMWSMGCVIAEMLLGRRLYPGKTSKDQLIMITSCQGALPHCLLCKGLTARTYYNYDPCTGFSLKEEEFDLMPESWDTNYKHYTFQLNSLDDVAKVDNSASFEEKEQLMSLLNMMLHKNPQWRCSPEEALVHDFFKITETTDS